MTIRSAKGSNVAKESPTLELGAEASGRGAPGPRQVLVGGHGYSYYRYIPGTISTPTKPENETSTEKGFGNEASSPSSKRKRDVADQPPAESPPPQSKKAKKSRKKNDINGVNDVNSTSQNSVKVKDASRAEGTEEEGREESEVGPSARTTRLGINGGSGATEGTNPRHESKDEVSPSKSKKEKKEKRKKRKEADDTSVDVEELVPQDTPMMDAPNHAHSETTTTDFKPKKDKKKKQREEKKSEGNEPGDEVASDDATEKRHKTVLERKAKSLKLAEDTAKRNGDEEQLLDELEEVHELGPLPQPKAAPAVEPKLTYETLPSWLAAPIRVSQGTKKPFSDLGILPKAARSLEQKGYPNAFAVQTAAIPLLLPTSQQRSGDLLISAATGSGKTLAYALPIVRDISQGFVTRLRALVVLPTRELVKQAQEVFEFCAKAYEGGDRKRVRIGIAVGSQTLKSEQEYLVESQKRYDPAAYKQLTEEKASQMHGILAMDPEYGQPDPRLGPWEGEVVDFFSRVDVLICTPGRLVEHIEQTPGFDLDYIRWLVVDEADKLLAQSFQGWLEVVLEMFRTDKFTAREFPDMDLNGVRKVVLSATLTRDLSLLSQLALRRPQLIVLEDEGDSVAIAEHSLPPQLEEFAIRVHNTNLKPLYLLDLLRSEHMSNSNSSEKQASVAEDIPSADSDDTSDTSSDGSNTSSEDESSSSDSDSDSESASEADTNTTKKGPEIRTTTLPTTLIFTKSNESALRLSRLLTILDKSLSAHISTLTSTTPTHIRRKTLRAFSAPSSSIRLIIASDLVARGIDIPQLDHVINYDLPPSVAGYVHRVGRTARAGRSGRAWTLVGDDESGWFWGKIAKGASVRRAQKVDRIRIEITDEDRVKDYESALDKLAQEALVMKRR